jgi:hypothetical protein
VVESCPLNDVVDLLCFNYSERIGVSFGIHGLPS